MDKSQFAVIKGKMLSISQEWAASGFSHIQVSWKDIFSVLKIITGETDYLIQWGVLVHLNHSIYHLLMNSVQDIQEKKCFTLFY